MEGLREVEGVIGNPNPITVNINYKIEAIMHKVWVKQIA